MRRRLTSKYFSKIKVFSKTLTDQLTEVKELGTGGKYVEVVREVRDNVTHQHLDTTTSNILDTPLHLLGQTGMDNTNKYVNKHCKVPGRCESFNVRLHPVVYAKID